MYIIVWILFSLCCLVAIINVFSPLRKNRADETVQARTISLIILALEIYVFSTILFK